jgi:phage FluMu gp28-like protein
MEELEGALKALDQTPHYAFGFDFARVADLSVAALLSIEKNLKRREALSVEMRNVPGDEQKAIVRDILSAVRERLVGAAFDATGMGWTVAEDMGRIFGLREGEDSSGLVWAIKFTEDWYRLHMPPLKTAFEDDTIALIRDAEHLSDLRAVKLVRGTPRVPPTREGEKGKRRHGDFAIALALAHFASRMRWVEYGYRAAGGRDGRSGWSQPQADDVRARGWWESPLGSGLRGGL